MILEEKLPAATRQLFVAKVKQISKLLKIKPDWLMLIMYHESRFKPYIINSIGAVGLIQFMPATCAWLGTTPQYLAGLTAVQQLDWVYKYYKPKAGVYRSFFDLYMYTFFPIAVGKPNNFVLQSKNLSAGSIAEDNKGFDLNKDRKITVWEFKKYLKENYLRDTLKLSPLQIADAIAPKWVEPVLIIGGLTILILLQQTLFKKKIVRTFKKEKKNDNDNFKRNP